MSVPMRQGIFLNKTMSLSPSDLAALRRSYERAELDESASHADPLQQFARWFEEALKAFRFIERMSKGEDPLTGENVGSVYTDILNMDEEERKQSAVGTWDGAL